MTMTDAERAEKLAAIQPLLEAAQAAQTAYWDAVRELEVESGADFDGEDLESLTAEDVLANAEANAEDEDDEDDDDSK
jgi:hypothetical protein